MTTRKTKPKPKRTRAIIYSRISEDTRGEFVGVNRQLKEGREYAARLDLDVVAEATDNDISALKGKHRPGYERVRDLIRAGEVEAVVAYQQSRLWRNRPERAQAITEWGEYRVAILFANGVDLDLSTASGRAMAGLLGEFDTMESEIKSERILSAVRDRAESGMPNGKLGYGWVTHGKGRDRTFEIDADAAYVVQMITKKLLAGETLNAITRDLNARGIPAPSADRWGKTSVKKIALRPANAGLVALNTKTGDLEVFDGEAKWPAIVEREQWEAVRALLRSPGRQVNGTTRPGARKHLLTFGIGVCGRPVEGDRICGSQLKAAMRGTKGHRKMLYLCNESEHLGRNQAKVDEMVREVIIDRLSRPDALEWALGDDDAAKKAGQVVLDLHRRLDDATDQYADGMIDGNQLARITKQLRPRIEAAEREHERRSARLNLTVLADVAGPKAAARWDALQIAQQRVILDALGVRVTILPTRRGSVFYRDHVRVEVGVTE